MTVASHFLAAQGQATSSLNKPSHPLPVADTGGDGVDNFYSFFSPLFQGAAEHVTALSFTEMISSCQNVLEEVHSTVSLSSKAVAECGLML